MVVVLVAIASFVFNVSTTSLGYWPVTVVTTSEKTFQTMSITTLEHAEIQVTTSGNDACTSTISTGYNYITNTHKMSPQRQSLLRQQTLQPRPVLFHSGVGFSGDTRPARNEPCHCLPGPSSDDFRIPFS